MTGRAFAVSARLANSAIRSNAAMLVPALLLACTVDTAGPADLETPPFSISLSASKLGVEQGWAGFLTVNVARGDGFTDPVYVGIDNLPPGVVSRPDTIDAGRRQCVVKFSVYRTAQPGSYPITVRATSEGGSAATAGLVLEVVPTWFRIRADSTSLIVRQNDASGTILMNVERSEEFNDAVAMSVEGGPPGLEATLSGGYWGYLDLWVLSATVSSDVATGNYPLTVTGSAYGVADQHVTIDVTVLAESPGVSAVEPQVAVGAGHTCGLTADGTAYCWGGNSSGKLGDGTIINRPDPVPVSTGMKFSRLALGAHHSCGLSTAGRAYCWGSNSSGQLGDSATLGPVSRVLTPLEVSGGQFFTEIAAGASHTCALTVHGAAYCWGENWTGALGDGTTIDRAVPVAVSDGMRFVSIVAAGGKTCGLTQWGSAYCWGQNYPGGQLGDGSNVNRLTPTAVAGLHTFASLASASCGLLPSGAAYCWGGDFNSGGSVPTPVPGNLRFVQFNGACGLTTNGTAVCRGSPPIGDGTPFGRSVFVAVAGDLTFTSLAGGRCGITADGSTYCWGLNLHGEVGDRTTVPRLAPVQVYGGLRFVHN